MKTQLRWFGHVQRKPLKAPLRKVDQMPNEKGKRKTKEDTWRYY